PRPLPTRPGPVERALRDLWTPAVRRRLMRPRYWADWLYLRRHYDLRELDARELRLDMPVGLLPDCEGCTEVCCTGPTRVVLLRLLDVAALVDAGLQDHVTQEKPTFSPSEIEKNPALHDMVHGEAWRMLPILRQDGTRSCTLLTEDNRCGAFPSWPLSCARFPYSLDVLRARVFYAGSCRSRVQDRSAEARAREKSLVEAVVEAYNQRIRDAVLLRVARPELEELGLGRFIRW
ncbi:MAG: hypothetical protein AB2A00_10075, partial [Myxococcota bacterium]